MKPHFDYNNLIKKHPVILELIHFFVSLTIHLVIFLVLNLIPNNAPAQATWTHVQTTKKSSGRGSQGMEVINMVPSDEVRVVQGKASDKKGSAKKGKKIDKQKLYDVKKKKSFNSKITAMKKKEEEALDKLVTQKNVDINKEKRKPVQMASLPKMGSERGSRSITERSPLSAPSSEQIGQISKKVGKETGDKDKIEQKAATAPPPPVKKEEKPIETKKAPVEPVKKLAEPKKIEIKTLATPKPKTIIDTPKPEPLVNKALVENLLKKIPEEMKKTILEEKTPKPSERVEKKVEIKEILKLEPEKIAEKKADLTPKLPETAPEKIIKEAVKEIAKKSSIFNPALSQVGMDPKKISVAKSDVLTGKEIAKAPVQDVEKIEKKIAPVQEAVDKPIKDIDGFGPPISISAKTEKVEVKTAALTPDDRIKEKDDTKTAPEIEKAESKVMRTLEQNTPLKNRMETEPIMKKEFKRILIASANEEQKKETTEKKEKLDEEKKIEEKSDMQEDFKKLLQEVTQEIQKEEEKKVEKTYDTSLKIFDETAISTKIEEDFNKEAKIIGDKNISAAGDKGEAMKTVKVLRMFDRNPSSVTKSTPLTRVSKGGSVRRVVMEGVSPEEMQKIGKVLEEIKKIEAKSGEDGGGANFEPIMQKIDMAYLESLLFKQEESGVDGGEGGMADASKEMMTEKEMEQTGSFQDGPETQTSGPSSMFKEKQAFSMGSGDVSGSISKGFDDISSGKSSGGKSGVYGLKDKQISEIEQRLKEITAFSKSKSIKITGRHKFPNITTVAHNATHTLGKGDELVVTLQGDPGEMASFDIGLFRTEISMNEVAPGVYRGIYRVIEGDNIINAAIVGYLMNKENVQASMPSSSTITLDTSPGVTIATPLRDTTVDKAVQTVSGVIDDHAVSNIVLSLNGNMRNVSVEDGYFNVDVDLVKGKNIIEVMAVNSKGDIGKDHIEITYATFKAGAKVAIIFPSDGDIVNISESPVIEVRGTVSDYEVKKAKLIANDLSMDISVQNGEFAQKVVVFSEVSSYVVQVIDKDGIIGMSEPINIKTSGMGHYDAVVSLNWDAPQADLDLVVKNSTGKFVSHKSPNSTQNPNAFQGGNLELDDKGGFGPEVITLKQVTAGLYSIHASYYEGNGDKSVNATITIVLTDPRDSSKSTSKVFGPKTMNVGEEWKVTFIGLPEMGFYASE